MLPPIARQAIPPINPDIAASRAGFSRIAGLDEAGRGPWAGPVVAASVILRRTPLAVRIDDSKRLTRAQRLRAFCAISEQADVGVGIACAQEIDGSNILQATLRAMERAVDDLPAAAELVLVDGPIAPRLAQPCWPIIHGDRLSYVIACASIVAKVFRDGLMEFYDQLCPEYAFGEHKGYGTSLHARQLRQHGASVFHRYSFRPVLSTIAEARHASPGNPALAGLGSMGPPAPLEP